MSSDKDWVDDVLMVGGCFDWITPTVAFVQDWLNAPAAHFGIYAGVPGWGRGDIKDLLRRYEIKVWGFLLSLDNEVLTFSVPAVQANQAYRVMGVRGAPFYAIPSEALER